jgi:hypothetical protein
MKEKIYKGKLSEVRKQIKKEAQDYKLSKENPSFVKLGNVLSHKKFLDRMVKLGSISQEKADKLLNDLS